MFNVHEENDECKEFGCCLHNPTPEWEHMPLNWREDRGLMERVCECGIGHPDIDDINWKKRAFGKEFADTESIHGCCGKEGHCPCAAE